MCALVSNGCLSHVHRALARVRVRIWLRGAGDHRWQFPMGGCRQHPHCAPAQHKSGVRAPHRPVSVPLQTRCLSKDMTLLLEVELRSCARVCVCVRDQTCVSECCRFGTRYYMRNFTLPPVPVGWPVGTRFLPRCLAAADDGTAVYVREVYDGYVMLNFQCTLCAPEP